MRRKAVTNKFTQQRRKKYVKPSLMTVWCLETQNKTIVREHLKGLGQHYWMHFRLMRDEFVRNGMHPQQARMVAYKQTLIDMGSGQTNLVWE